jgi:hypothetical protein
MTNKSPFWMTRRFAPHVRVIPSHRSSQDAAGAAGERVILLIGCHEICMDLAGRLNGPGRRVVSVSTYGAGVGPFHPDSASAGYIDRMIATTAPTDLAICGHLHCRPLEALAGQLDAPGEGIETQRLLRTHYPDLTGAALIEVAAQEHLLVQADHLGAYPSIADLPVWPTLSVVLVDERSDEVLVYDSNLGQFTALTVADDGMTAKPPLTVACA